MNVKLDEGNNENNSFSINLWKSYIPSISHKKVLKPTLHHSRHNSSKENQSSYHIKDIRSWSSAQSGEKQRNLKKNEYISHLSKKDGNIATEIDEAPITRSSIVSEKVHSKNTIEMNDKKEISAKIAEKTEEKATNNSKSAEIINNTTTHSNNKDTNCKDNNKKPSDNIEQNKDTNRGASSKDSKLIFTEYQRKYNRQKKILSKLEKPDKKSADVFNKKDSPKKIEHKKIYVTKAEFLKKYAQKEVIGPKISDISLSLEKPKNDQIAKGMKATFNCDADNNVILKKMNKSDIDRKFQSLFGDSSDDEEKTMPKDRSLSQTIKLHEKRENDKQIGYCKPIKQRKMQEEIENVKYIDRKPVAKPKKVRFSDQETETFQDQVNENGQLKAPNFDSSLVISADVNTFEIISTISVNHNKEVNTAREEIVVNELTENCSTLNMDFKTECSRRTFKTSYEQNQCTDSCYVNEQPEVRNDTVVLKQPIIKAIQPTDNVIEKKITPSPIAIDLSESVIDITPEISVIDLTKCDETNEDFVETKPKDKILKINTGNGLDDNSTPILNVNDPTVEEVKNVEKKPVILQSASEDTKHLDYDYEISANQIRALCNAEKSKIVAILFDHLHFLAHLRKAQNFYSAYLGSQSYNKAFFGKELELFRRQNCRRICLQAQQVSDQLHQLNLRVSVNLDESAVEIMGRLTELLTKVRGMPSCVTKPMVYLLMWELFEPLVSSYKNCPLLNALVMHCQAVIMKIRNQIVKPSTSSPSDPFTADMRQRLKYQIQQYWLLCHAQIQLLHCSKPNTSFTNARELPRSGRGVYSTNTVNFLPKKMPQFPEFTSNYQRTMTEVMKSRQNAQSGNFLRPNLRPIQSDHNYSSNCCDNRNKLFNNNNSQSSKTQHCNARVQTTNIRTDHIDNLQGTSFELRRLFIFENNQLIPSTGSTTTTVAKMGDNSNNNIKNIMDCSESNKEMVPTAGFAPGINKLVEQVNSLEAKEIESVLDKMNNKKDDVTKGNLYLEFDKSNHVVKSVVSNSTGSKRRRETVIIEPTVSEELPIPCQTEAKSDEVIINSDITKISTIDSKLSDKIEPVQFPSVVTDEEASALTSCYTEEVIINDISETSIIFCSDKDSISPSKKNEENIETIDLTWIDDIDAEELQENVNFACIKKETENNNELDDEVTFTEVTISEFCTVCGESASYVCVCRGVRYCGRVCQVIDWNNHQSLCLNKQYEG